MATYPLKSFLCPASSPKPRESSLMIVNEKVRQQIHVRSWNQHWLEKWQWIDDQSICRLICLWFCSSVYWLIVAAQKSDMEVHGLYITQGKKKKKYKAWYFNWQEYLSNYHFSARSPCWDYVIIFLKHCGTILLFFFFFFSCVYVCHFWDASVPDTQQAT